MKVRDFLEKAKNLINSNLFDKILDHEVSIQMHTEEGVYIGNSFECDSIGYKFSPWRTNEDGTKGSLVLDIHIVNKKISNFLICFKIK